MLEIKNLCVSMDGRELLHDISLRVPRGARHLLLGPNGSGKSTLVQTIAGNPEFTVDSGKITFNRQNILDKNTTTRALLGIFVGSQNVPEIPGLTVLSFLKHSCIAHHHFDTGRDLSMAEFLTKLESAREKLNIPKDWLNRGINVGFSGGERKRLMLLQLIMTKPKLAILDEPDSGADVDTQKQIANTIAEMKNTTFLFISHQPQFTKMVKPTHETKLKNGKVIGG
ncbi:MAG: Fe-S cluster assembly ATPase SufC [Alphaproteobacteria bacterium]|nr:Fe-S cluster assembly ATPase SufC [Alphaproteobacteria bacterium]